MTPVVVTWYTLGLRRGQRVLHVPAEADLSVLADTVERQLKMGRTLRVWDGDSVTCYACSRRSVAHLVPGTPIPESL